MYAHRLSHCRKDREALSVFHQQKETPLVQMEQSVDIEDVGYKHRYFSLAQFLQVLELDLSTRRVLSLYC